MHSLTLNWKSPQLSFPCSLILSGASTNICDSVSINQSMQWKEVIFCFLNLHNFDISASVKSIINYQRRDFNDFCEELLIAKFSLKCSCAVFTQTWAACVFSTVCVTLCVQLCVSLCVTLCVHRKVNNYYTFLILGGKFDCSFSACKVLSAVQLWFKLDSANSASDSVRFWFCQFCLRFCHTGFLNGLGQWKPPRSFFRLKWGFFECFEKLNEVKWWGSFARAGSLGLRFITTSCVFEHTCNISLQLCGNKSVCCKVVMKIFLCLGKGERWLPITCPLTGKADGKGNC